MLRLASAALIMNTVTFEQRKLIFKGPKHVQHFFPLTCHIVVDSGLNNIVYTGTTEGPVEPYEGQLKSISPILLLKDVVIIPVFFFFPVRGLRWCAFAAEGEPLVSHSKKRLELDLSRSICPLESRGFYFNGSAILTPAMCGLFFFYIHTIGI